MDVRSSRRKSSALLSCRVIKALALGSNSSRSPSVGAKNAERPLKALVWKDVKNPAECPSSSNDNADVDMVRKCPVGKFC